MAHYRGYEVCRCPRSLPAKYGGYATPGIGVAWFTGKTPQEVFEQIDAALAELPEPSFEDA